MAVPRLNTRLVLGTHLGAGGTVGGPNATGNSERHP